MDNYWQQCSRAFSLDQYLNRFAVASDQHTNYESLAAIVQRLSEQWKNLLGQVGTQVPDIKLFETPFNRAEHNMEVFPMLLRQPEYQAYVKRLIAEGKLPMNTIAEIQSWGYSSNDPSIGEKKARVLPYHPEYASDLFGQVTNKLPPA